MKGKKMCAKCHEMERHTEEYARPVCGFREPENGCTLEVFHVALPSDGL